MPGLAEGTGKLEDELGQEAVDVSAQQSCHDVQHSRVARKRPENRLLAVDSEDLRGAILGGARSSFRGASILQDEELTIGSIAALKLRLALGSAWHQGFRTVARDLDDVGLPRCGTPVGPRAMGGQAREDHHASRP